MAKLSRKVIEKVSEMLKGADVKLKETKKCEHENLRQIKKEGMWYQCRKCKQIFFIFGCILYNKEILKIELEEIIKNAK